MKSASGRVHENSAYKAEKNGKHKNVVRSERCFVVWEAYCTQKTLRLTFEKCDLSFVYSSKWMKNDFTLLKHKWNYFGKKLRNSIHF